MKSESLFWTSISRIHARHWRKGKKGVGEEVGEGKGQGVGEGERGGRG